MTAGDSGSRPIFDSRNWIKSGMTSKLHICIPASRSNSASPRSSFLRNRLVPLLSFPRPLEGLCQQDNIPPNKKLSFFAKTYCVGSWFLPSLAPIGILILVGISLRPSNRSVPRTHQDQGLCISGPCRLYNDPENLSVPCRVQKGFQTLWLLANVK